MPIIIPSFETGDPITPAGRPSEPNPYEDYLRAMGLTVSGYSVSQSVVIDAEEGHLQALAIRRAARKLKITVSVIEAELTDDKGESTGQMRLTFGIIPTRVRNTETGQVESPTADEPVAEAVEPVAEPKSKSAA